MAKRGAKVRKDADSGMHRSPASPMPRSGYPVPKLESHITPRENPIKSHDENCCIGRIPDAAA